jgi:hypothetical protein
MDKAFQVRAAAEVGIVVPRTWLPNSWEDIAALVRVDIALWALPRQRSSAG